ncbi:ABC-2 transporter permease [Clostridium guangxiense]|nr:MULTISPECIES: ABC-2 transporter permease [Clostridium]MCD2347141.1 ABC-2 transporter permease [Clostridium guangxiense]
MYKFGFIKLRNILVIIVFMIPITGGYIAKWLQSNNIDFQYITSLPKLMQELGPYVLALIITGISMALSIHIYSRKDL